MKTVNEPSNVNEKMPYGWNLQHEYGVFRTGGSIGETYPGDIIAHFGRDAGILVRTYSTEQEAKEQAKVSRKRLSPGERKYYGISYKVKRLDDKLKGQISAAYKQ